MKHVLPVMLKQNKGSIINTASIAGLIGSPMIAVYSASKHAVIGLTKSAAWECTGTGVRVNCVCPGLIDSRMLSTILQGRNRRQRAAAEREDRRPDSGAAARTGLRSRLHRGVPRLRRGELRLRLRLHRRRRPHRRLIFQSTHRGLRPAMPVILDPDAAAVYKAFQEAGRPAYETLTAPEAREYYLAAPASSAIPSRRNWNRSSRSRSPPRTARSRRASTRRRRCARRTVSRRAWYSSMAAAG